MVLLTTKPLLQPASRLIPPTNNPTTACDPVRQVNNPTSWHLQDRHPQSLCSRRVRELLSIYYFPLESIRNEYTDLRGVLPNRDWCITGPWSNNFQHQRMSGRPEHRQEYFGPLWRWYPVGWCQRQANHYKWRSYRYEGLCLNLINTPSPVVWYIRI